MKANKVITVRVYIVLKRKTTMLVKTIVLTISYKEEKKARGKKMI
jgi:hypothetical protein